MGRYRHVRQTSQADCGAAALGAITLYYGLPISHEHLRLMTGTGRVGSSMLGLAVAAEQLGFRARALQGTFEQLREVPLPVIAQVTNTDGYTHFIVVYRISSRSVTVADPAAAEIQTWPVAEFQRKWTGYILALAPEGQLIRPEHVAVKLSPGQRFLGLLSAHTPILLEAFICAVLMTVLGIGSALFIQYLIDTVLVRQEYRLLNALAVGMVLLVLFKTGFGVLRQYILAHVGRKVDLMLLSGYTRHVLRLPLSFFESRQTGDVLNRINDAAQIRSAINGTTLSAVLDAVLVVVFMACLWAYDWPLAGLTTAFVPLVVLSIVIFHRPAKRLSRASMEESARLSSHIIEDLTGVETIKTCNAERLRADQGESLLLRVSNNAYALQMLSLAMGSLGSTVQGVAGLSVLWFGGIRVMEGHLSIGELMFFNAMLGNLLSPLERLASVNISFQEALAATDRFYQILEIPTEPIEDPKRKPFVTLQQGLALRNLSFAYQTGRDVLRQISLEIPKGSTIAIVGESGSGKTTLLKLLAGLYTPTAGQLLVDGVDLRDFELTSLRRRIGVVAQDPFIFSGTIASNIALGVPEASLAEIAEAATAAGLAEFINQLPERYNAKIGERGINLSGGQRQRLAIARVLLAKPDLVIFDEATSHLDTATERLIQDSLRAVLAGRTVVIVAHRLSTILHADVIYVLAQGQLIEAGRHGDLLKQDGYYARLWRAQTGEDLLVRPPGMSSWSITPGEGDPPPGMTYSRPS